MKKYLFLSLLFLKLIGLGQVKLYPKTDFNTLYICIDSTSYNQLFQSKYIKDTLFFCRELYQETTTDSYSGKYLIGESATLEFFKPKQSHELGDRFGDWGIEYKTRKINTLDELFAKSKTLNVSLDTSTTKTVLDSLPIPWYKTLSFKNTKNELAILEYQASYLEGLGFTKKQQSQSMTYKEFNTILTVGKKYPRQFAMVTYIKMYADKQLILDLEKFSKLNNCKKNNNTITNGETTIEYQEVESLPQFPIQEIGLSLLNNQKLRILKISENMQLKVEGKKARISFKNYN